MSIKGQVRSALGLAAIMMVVCGFVFPVAVTGIGQAAFHYQANGSAAYLNNTEVGSYLIGQSTTSPFLFHTRNNSASGIDPDITDLNATSQAYRIHNDTGVSMSYLDGLIKNNTRYTMFFFGTEYVNALSLNLQIIEQYHATKVQYRTLYKEVTVAQ